MNELSYANKKAQVLADLVFEEDREEVDVCPICGSTNFIKYGKDRNGNQRYQCRSCHKFFNTRTNTFFYWSHITSKQWQDFIYMEKNKCSLDEEAKKLHLSRTTCFYMRHKLSEAYKKEALVR